MIFDVRGFHQRDGEGACLDPRLVTGGNDASREPARRSAPHNYDRLYRFDHCPNSACPAQGYH